VFVKEIFLYRMFCDDDACNPLFPHDRNEELRVHWVENHSTDIVNFHSTPLMLECTRLVRQFLQKHSGTQELW